MNAESTLISRRRRVAVDVWNVATFDACPLQKFDAVDDAIEFVENYSLDACLNDELGTVETRRRGDVERRAFRRVVGACYFRDCIGFGMEHISFCETVFVLTNVFKSGGSPIETVGNNSSTFDHQRTDFSTFAI